MGIVGGEKAAGKYDFLLNHILKYVKVFNNVHKIYV